MPGVFDQQDVTVPAGAAIRLSTLLVDEGYTGNFIGAYLEIDPRAVADLYHGTSNVSATIGRSFDGNTYTRQAMGPRVCVDPARIYLFSATGGEIGVTFETF